MSNYSRKELKRMLKTKSCPVDAPSFIQQELDRQRIEFNRNARSIEEEMDLFMDEDARRWQPVKRPNWANWFKKILGRPTRFANKLRALINR